MQSNPSRSKLMREGWEGDRGSWEVRYEPEEEMVDKDTEARWKQEDKSQSSPEVDLYFAAKSVLEAWETGEAPSRGDLRDAVEVYEKSGAILKAKGKHS